MMHVHFMSEVGTRQFRASQLHTASVLFAGHHSRTAYSTAAERAGFAISTRQVASEDRNLRNTRTMYVGVFT